MFGLQGSCSPPLMDERTNLLPINSPDFRQLWWPERREFRCAKFSTPCWTFFWPEMAQVTASNINIHRRTNCVMEIWAGKIRRIFFKRPEARS